MASTLFAGLVNRELHGDYYDALDRKHFRPDGVGSVFDTYRCVEDLLEAAVQQRGHLNGDDRDLLTSLGADPDSFVAGCRYLHVRADGRVGIVRSDRLGDDTVVEAVATKPGCPPSLCVRGVERTITGDAVIVIGDDGDGERLWTAHPGIPIRPASGDSTTRDGQQFTVAELVGGRRPMWLQIR